MKKIFNKLFVGVLVVLMASSNDLGLVSAQELQAEVQELDADIENNQSEVVEDVEETVTETQDLSETELESIDIDESILVIETDSKFQESDTEESSIEESDTEESSTEESNEEEKALAKKALAKTEILKGTNKEISQLQGNIEDILDLTSEVSNNMNEQNYFTWGSPVYSYLENTNQGLMRLEYVNNAVIIEYYDNNYNVTAKKKITGELDKFGGFYSGKDAYYIVFGQNNPDENDETEILRIIKYTKNWERVGQVSIQGANTVSPFDAGSCRMTEYNGILYIRTCHTMYKSSDGNNHQANMTFLIDEMKMETIIANYTVSYYEYATAYISHSFNQFIIADDAGNVIALDHGDAYPRRINLVKFNDSRGNGYPENVSLLDFKGSIGDNKTGASIGGLAYSDSVYLTVGNSVVQDENWKSHTARNVFVTTTSRDKFSSEGTTIQWLTNYDTDGEISASTPQLVKLNNNRFLVMWTTKEYADERGDNSTISKLHYVFLDGKGKVTSEVHTVDGQLSDCQPIVVDNVVNWYVTGDSNRNNSTTVPYFYQIDSDGTYHSFSKEIDLKCVEKGIQVSWQKATGIESYKVYRKKDNSKYSLVATTSESSWVDTTATDGSQYTYYVCVYVGNEMKIKSLEKSCTWKVLSLDVQNQSNGIYAIWNNLNIDNIDKYELHFNYTYYTFGSSVKRFAISTYYLESGTNYDIYVRAYDSSGNMLQESEHKIIIYLSRPTITVDNSESNVHIKWDNVTGAESYKIYRKTESTEYELLKEISDTTWKDTTAKGGETYIYQVVACAKNSMSYASEPCSVTYENGNENGLVQVKDSVWHYMKDGVFQKDYTGLVQHQQNKNWYYVENGVINWKYTGIVYRPENKNKYYVEKGMLNWNYTGLVQDSNDKNWYYIEKGMYNPKYTGLVQHSGNKNWYYVEKGMINWKYTGLVQHSGNKNWYYVEKGMINWKYTGLVYRPENKNWYYVEKGMINWKYTGLVYRPENKNWYYVEKGMINWKYTGLVYRPENKNWYYVEKGMINWKYTGVVYRPENKNWYYVEKGTITWKYTGTVKYNDKQYQVVKSVVKI